ncbi:MAG: hypothetical protein HKN23_18840 [Verrucomicrobiales bacterium]|nr:hypothetical protein [Verrucomicrobiales bacterium]
MTSDSPQEPDTNHAEIHLPDGLQHKLEEFRSRLWAVKIAEGALAAIVGLAISYLVVFGLDRFFDTPGWLRALILVGGASVLGLGLPLRWHKWVWNQRSLESVSRLLKHRFPRLGDQLLGIVELAKQGEDCAHSRSLVRAAMAQVDEKVKDRDFSDAVPNNHHRAWTMGAIGAMAVAMLTVFLVSDAARNAMARWLMPWKNVDRYTFANVQDVPEKMVVPYAEPVDFSTALTDDSRWKPEVAVARIPGTKEKLEAENVEDQFHFNLPPLKDGGAMKLKIGDDRERVEVEPMTRPELQNLIAKIRLPDYLLYDHDPEQEIRGGTVSVVKGAKATIRGTAAEDRKLKRVEVDGNRTLSQDDWFETIAAEVTHSHTRELNWEDEFGLTPKEPLKLRINAVDDAAPDVFAKKLTREQVVLEDEVVSFDISAGDDFGVKKVGLEWHGVKDALHNPEPEKGDKLVAAGDPQKRDVAVQGTFSAKREGVKPQTLQVRAFAEDYKPERERSYSPTFVIHVMSPDDHARWLTDQFSKWFKNAREVYEKEQQLYETNKELRKMDPDDLDRPENRRAVEKQANAEANNARRLDSLTGSGRELVRQATKNTEFDAERLETWATMLRSLDDIAKDRMPSVADLLKQTANAPGKGQQAAAKPGSPSKGGDPKGSKNQANSGDSKGSSPKGDPENANGESPKSSKPSGPIVGNPANSGKGKKPPEMEKSDQKIPAVPSVVDSEKGYLKEDGEDQKGDQPKKKPSPGKLTLPSTVLQGVSKKKKDEAGPPESPAQEKMDEAIAEQEDLLAEFAKVADQLQELLASLEASTFVKRLKAASRNQMEVATDLNTTLNGAFGMARDRVAQQLRETGEDVAKREEEESKKVYDIQTDLAAYFQRKQDVRYKKILDSMRETGIVRELKDIGETVKVNLNGRSIASAEYWADSLDRWAEELVSASECKACKGGSSDSLPPEVILKVMQILHAEMQLRDETRELEATRPALQPDEYEKRAEPLEFTQQEIRTKTDDVIQDIVDLPQGSEKFKKEIQLLIAVSDIMRAARGILARPDTGPEAIGAETEAIELLLQAKRQNPNGGGGGGSSPGGGGGGSTSAAALSDIGTGAAEDVEAPLRDIGQSTGRAGKEFPEEFRMGLDKYFNKLEGGGGGQ